MLREGRFIVDLLYVPQLLAEGVIAPLNKQNGFALAEMMQTRAEAHGVSLPTETVEMIRLLCSDEHGEVGALPLWINSHGRMIPDPQLFHERDEGRIATATSFDQVLSRDDAADVLVDAGIQSNFLAFELWAHLAYRGCRPFRTLARDEVPAHAQAGAGRDGDHQRAPQR